jgi:hypothetical protein
LIIPPIKWLKSCDIQASAEALLDRAHASRDLPVPVENITEQHFQLDIIPLPGLKAHFDFDGFLASDLSAIYVDQYVYENYENRYRFTLAHELGHLCLHDYVYLSVTISSMDDYYQFNEAIAHKQKDDMEWQANRFAGYLLAPDNRIVERWQNCQPHLAAMIDEAKRQRFEPHDYRDLVFESAADRMYRDFEMSVESMKLRLLTASSDDVIHLPE